MKSVNLNTDELSPTSVICREVSNAINHLILINLIKELKLR